MKKNNRFKMSKDLGRIVNQIVDNFHPLKVILFGSYASGSQGKDSDADLMVVMDTHERSLRMAGKIAARVDHPIPLDILVRTPDQIKERLSLGDPFIREILQEGIILYETAD
jgi:predicted nucleotidyltransferase